ncbi:hypothetical protein K8R14_02025 [bacterium]|nr:hypothetical protein [bacterium]
MANRDFGDFFVQCTETKNMVTFRLRKFLLFISVIVASGLYPLEGKCAVTPSQVLVLYNADWTEDAPLTDPGQDSREIAEHYVYMHTNQKTGEKPYILGLKCVHAARHFGESHLNGNHLVERSKDNMAGVVLWRKGKIFGSAGEKRDSRALEFTLPKGKSNWHFETFRVQLKSKRGNSVTLVEGGRSQHGNKVGVQEEGKWNVRANARRFLTGSFIASAACKDGMDKMHQWKAEYQDFLDVTCSHTGPDKNRDDQLYLEDVENQVKRFLEDPKNSMPDSTLLKNHILFIVVCYGLPRTTVATYGIARGITESLPNYGTIISLEQRLQIMYYDVESVMGFTPRPHRFHNKEPFAAYYFRAPQTWPLYGKQANPFMHPLVYEKEKSHLDKLSEPITFNSENRKRFPGKHLYFVMRIDAPTPLEARGLIDRAVYASKYGSRVMGQINGVEYTKTVDRVGKLDWTQTGSWLWEKGFRHLYYGGAARNRLEFLRLSPGKGFLNRTPVYLPGGVGGTVISHNSWNNKEMVRDLAMGVTATAGAARAYRGAPHIHNKSWWDDEILYPFLLKGRTMGEVLLMNQVHLGWISTFVGDPLYHWPLSEVRNKVSPKFDSNRDVQVWIKTGQNREQEVWLRVDLGSTPDSPVTGQLRAICEEGSEALCQTFGARPYAKLGNLQEACDRTWKVEVMDPYGNSFATDVMVDCAKVCKLKAD